MIEVLRPSTIPAAPAREPECYLTFYRTGRIRLSSGLCKAMELEPGARLVFITLNGHHYISAATKDDAWRLSGQGALHIQSKDLFTELARRFDFPPVKRVRLSVALAPQYINGFQAHQIILAP